MRAKEDPKPFVSIIVGVFICLLLVAFALDSETIARNPKWSVAGGVFITGLLSMFVYFLLSECFFPDE